MNIGMFTETYYPEINGVATSVLTLKMELEEMGHNVYVFTTTTPGAPENEHNVFRVSSLPCVFITERRVGLFYQPKLAGLIKKLDLDIIHTHTEFSLGIFGRIMAKELKIPILHTYHTIYEDYTHYVTRSKTLDRRAKAVVRGFTRRSCNNVNQVIVPTNKVKELLEHYNVYRDIEIVPTGISLDKFKQENYTSAEILALRESYQIAENDKVLLYLGRISKEKNIIEIIEAMPDFMTMHPNVKFVVVGNGPEKEILEKRTHELNLSDKIIFTGQQPWDTIAKYYQLGNVFVSGSQSETQGLTYIEAMAAGLPVVAKDDPCLDEILEEGYNGYTFVEKEELIQGLDKVLFSDTAVDYRANAVHKVIPYSTEEFANNIIRVYEKAMRDFAVLVQYEEYEVNE